MTKNHTEHTAPEHRRIHALKQAHEIGADHGRDAASWVELDEDTAQAIDRDGVFEVFTKRSGPLSGEWADGYSVNQLALDVGLEAATDEDYQALADDLAFEYEDAYWQAFGAEIERQVETMRGPALPFFHGQVLRVEGWVGVAVHYEGQTFGGRALVVMVGDDREFVVDADDLTPLDDLDYCAECGQIGCTADGRDRDKP